MICADVVRSIDDDRMRESAVVEVESREVSQDIRPIVIQGKEHTLPVALRGQGSDLQSQMRFAVTGSRGEKKHVTAAQLVKHPLRWTIY